MRRLSGRDVACPENTGPDPHRGRAQADRHLIVGTHSHGEFFQTVLARQLGQKREMQTGGLLHRRDTHQAFERQAKRVAGLADKAFKLLRQKAGLLRLGPGIDLDIEPGPTPLRLHFPGQYARQLEPVDRFNDIKQGHRIGRLIGLQRPDQAQFEIRIMSAPPGPVSLGFLDPVLTEHALTGRQGRIDTGLRLTLGNRNQLDRV